MAVLPVPDSLDVESALEYAYGATQNVFDSWSLPIEEKRDGCLGLKVIARFDQVDGESFGHRSSMIGDRIVVIDDEITIHEVDSFGFRSVDASIEYLQSFRGFDL
jgi:hypothetical protein